jgi:hypothetical protein
LINCRGQTASDRDSIFALAGLRRGGQLGNVKFKGAAKIYDRYGFRCAMGATNPS